MTMIQEARPTRSPITWFGGKAKMARRIVELLPNRPHYVEPFGGAASVLLAREPAVIEVYNDLHDGVISLFQVISDPKLFPRFFGRVAAMPYSRSWWQTCYETWADCNDPAERAARWFVVSRQSFGGGLDSFGSSVQSVARGQASCCSRWKSVVGDLPAIHRRLRRVLIEKQDWRVILDRYKGESWLAYIDPPYVAATRRSGNYDHELVDRDHQDLVDVLLDWPGAVVLSGYPTPLYEPLEDAGWERIDIQWRSTTANTKAANAKGTDHQKRTECIWRNRAAQR